jgi:hypothetical protein
MSAPENKNKQKRKNVEDFGEKAQIYLTGRICRDFIWQVLFVR